MGDDLWGGADDIGRIVRQLPNGNYLISGTSESFGPGDFDLWFFETNGVGTPIWEKTYGTIREDRFRYISLSQDGGLIAWGLLDSIIHNTETPYVGLVQKLNSVGETQWRTFFNHQKNRVIWQLRELEDGNIVAIGRQQIGLFDSTAAWIAKLNPAGDVLWERFFFNKFYLIDSTYSLGADFYGDFQQTPDGGFVIAGIVWKGSEIYPNIGSWSQLWLVKLDSNGCMGPGDCGLDIDVGIEDRHEYQVSRPLQITVFPNPASEFANIYIKGNSTQWANVKVQITLYDMSGRQQYTEHRTLNPYGYTETQLNTAHLPPGVYVYSVISNEERLGEGKIVVE